MFVYYILYYLVINTDLNSMVDLDALAYTESGLKDNAYNQSTKATGRYQITEVCVRDYNRYHKVKFKLTDMFDSVKARKVANWYANSRIPYLLKVYKKKDSLRNRLIAYYCGVKNAGKAITKSNKKYIKRYLKYHCGLTKE